MALLDKSDEEIIKIAEPMWANLVKSSNIKDYGGFTRDLSSQMMYGAVSYTHLTLPTNREV